MKKKAIPITVLTEFETFLHLEGANFIVEKPGNDLLKIIDSDVDSNFYFKITKFQRNDAGYNLWMSVNPKNENELVVHEAWIKMNDLQNRFNSWVSVLDEFEIVSSFYDDPVNDAYKNEFFEYFEIVDEDAHIKPFSINQVLLLDEHLEKLDEKLSDMTSDKNETSLDQIHSEIAVLRENLSSRSKHWVARKLCSIWAKVAVQGPSFIRECLSEGKREVIKQCVKGVVDATKPLIIGLIS